MYLTSLSLCMQIGIVHLVLRDHGFVRTSDEEAETPSTRSSGSNGSNGSNVCNGSGGSNVGSGSNVSGGSSRSKTSDTAAWSLYWYGGPLDVREVRRCRIPTHGLRPGPPCRPADGRTFESCSYRCTACCRTRSSPSSPAANASPSRRGCGLTLSTCRGHTARRTLDSCREALCCPRSSHSGGRPPATIRRRSILSSQTTRAAAAASTSRPAAPSQVPAAATLGEVRMAKVEAVLALAALALMRSRSQCPSKAYAASPALTCRRFSSIAASSTCASSPSSPRGRLSSSTCTRTASAASPPMRVNLMGSNRCLIS